MDFPVECTHCRVIMTSWSVPGSLVRYHRCPFCTRTLSSAYGEVFRRRAGARLVERPAAEPPPGAAPLPTPDEIRWRQLKRRADRWFERLAAEEQPGTPARATAGARAAARKG